MSLLHYSWKGSPNTTSPLNTHQQSWLANWLALCYFDSAVWKKHKEKNLCEWNKKFIKIIKEKNLQWCILFQPEQKRIKTSQEIETFSC